MREVVYNEKGPVCSDPGVRRRLVPGGWPWYRESLHANAYADKDVHANAYAYPDKDVHPYPNPYTDPDRYPNTYTDEDYYAAARSFAQAQAAANASPGGTLQGLSLHGRQHALRRLDRDHPDASGRDLSPELQDQS
jgi:hypothetical protein